MKAMVYKLILAATFGSAALTTIAAEAQSITEVPFSFKVGAIVCPAGAYSVERDALGPFVALKSKNGREAFHWILQPGDPGVMGSGVVLHFDQVNQTHLLRSVEYHSLMTPRLDEGTLRQEHEIRSTRQGQ